MKHYNVPRQLAIAVLLALFAGCALFHKKPTPAPAPAPAPAPPAATVTAPAPATAPAPIMQAAAPERYTVKKGDTLWGIANIYLKNAWAWPDIWYANPAIKNPHLIFPGDVLVLGTNAQGQPTLSVERNGETVTEASPPPYVPPTPTAAAVSAVPAMAVPATPVAAVSGPALPVTKLEPQPRYLPLSAAVSAVPLDGLRPYLSKTRIVSSGELDSTGYLLSAFNGGPASGSGEEIYARNLKADNGTRYDIYRLGDKYVDPESGNTLGYEASYIGSASVEAWSDPQKLMITASTKEAIAGDRLLPASGGSAIDLSFFPHRPDKTVEGEIMAVQGGVGQIGQYDVVVLNRGTDAGVTPGTVLGIYRRGLTAKDPNGGWYNNSVDLPTERTGTLMVFRSFSNASYALVMQATSEIHLADIIGNP